MSGQPKLVDSLQLDRDVAWEQREHGFQRTGYWLITAFVLVALSGLMGEGPLSAAVARSADRTVRVEYERFVRRGASWSLRLESSGPEAARRILVPRALLRSASIEQITPPPDRSGSTGEGMVFWYDAGVRMAEFRILPVRAGWVGAELEVDGQRLRLNHLIYF